MITLYYSSLCPRSLCLKALLDWHGNKYEPNHRSLGDKDDLEFSIYKEVPILVDGSKVIEDIRAILRYLEETHWKSSFLSAPLPQKAEVYDALDILFGDSLATLLASRKPQLSKRLRRAFFPKAYQPALLDEHWPIAFEQTMSFQELLDPENENGLYVQTAVYATLSSLKDQAEYWPQIQDNSLYLKLAQKFECEHAAETRATA